MQRMIYTLHKTFLIGIYLTVNCTFLYAQNLVPNGSFEIHDTCPSLVNGFNHFPTDWENLNSADYFNACNDDGLVDVPFNQFGYQYALDGVGYVGMATSGLTGAPWYREIVGAQLLQPLQPGVPVCLSFKMAVGGFGSWSGNSSYHTCKGVGLKFFNVIPSDWQSYLYPNDAAIHLDVLPTDTAVWYSISGTYIPDSAYTHILVGNFFADSLNDVTILDSTGFGGFEPSYAFIDDVRVSYDLSFCTSPQGVMDQPTSPVIVYPVPFDQMILVQFPKSPGHYSSFQLINSYGQVCSEGTPRTEGHQLVIVPSDLPDGAYTLHLFGQAGQHLAFNVMHFSP